MNSNAKRVYTSPGKGNTKEPGTRTSLKSDQFWGKYARKHANKTEFNCLPGVDHFISYTRLEYEYLLHFKIGQVVVGKVSVTFEDMLRNEMRKAGHPAKKICPWPIFGQTFTMGIANPAKWYWDDFKRRSPLE